MEIPAGAGTGVPLFAKKQWAVVEEALDQRANPPTQMAPSMRVMAGREGHHR